MHKRLFQKFDCVCILDGVRKPMVDYQGAFADADPIDLGIKAARALLARADIDAGRVDSVLAGNMAPGGLRPVLCAAPHRPVRRRTGRGAGADVSAHLRHWFRAVPPGRRADRRRRAALAQVVGTESMTRNPIAAFDHRGGFRLGAPIGFKDCMWEALTGPAAAISMIQTAENLAKKYEVTRDAVDAFASSSITFARELKEIGARWGVASACIGGGQGIAPLIENPEFR